MDDQANRVATLANIVAYDSAAARRYIDGAPHVKHSSLKRLYGKLVVQVYEFAATHATHPKVLDLGAGEGSATLPFLEIGAKVTAVDASKRQLNELLNKYERFSNRLEVRCGDVNEFLKSKNDSYDIIVASSFLHHVPDYIGLIREAITLLTPCGQFFLFQEPLRYDSLGRFTTAFNTLAYFSWRVFGGDLVRGFKRRVRRGRGIYLHDSLEDNAEYHVIRNGVDQDAITNLLKEKGFDCNLVHYFSTQSRIFQPIGASLSIKNTFAMIARRCM